MLSKTEEECYELIWSQKMFSTLQKVQDYSKQESLPSPFTVQFYSPVADWGEKAYCSPLSLLCGISHPVVRLSLLNLLLCMPSSQVLLLLVQLPNLNAIYQQRLLYSSKDIFSVQHKNLRKSIRNVILNKIYNTLSPVFCL